MIRLISTVIFLTWPVGTQVIVSAGMVGTKQSQMLLKPLLYSEAMER
jgi:hypothetical protein